MIGIYCIHNKVNDKIYIGSAVNISNRFCVHKSNLKKGTHENQYLQNAYNKYEKENFIFFGLEEVENENDLIKREQYWIDNTKCYKRDIGYNINLIAGSSLGCKLSDEHKRKISESQKGNTNAKGNKLSDEQRRKLSEANKGKKLSDEHKRKISEAHIGENHPMYGKTHSEETKQKMSIAKKNMSEETKQKMSIAKKNMSEETKQKIREANLGKKHSEETKQKMSKAHIGKPRSEESEKKGGC